MIPEASTPSQLFVPCVSFTRLKVAPAEPIPPALTEVSNVSESACAPVPTCAWSAPLVTVTVPRSRLPVPVAVKTPASAIVAVPEMWRLCAAVTSIVWRSIPVYSGVAAVRSCQSSGVAPTPLARFSFSSPFVTEIVSGSTFEARA